MHDRYNRPTLILAWLSLGLLSALYAAFGLFDIARDGLAHAHRPAITMAALSAAWIALIAVSSLSPSFRAAISGKSARRVWFSVFPAVLLLFVMEAGTGGYVRLKFPRQTTYTDDRLKTPMYAGYDWPAEIVRLNGKIRYDYAPYRLWQVREMQSDLMNVSADGRRKTFEPPAQERAPEFRVQVYGGSTVFCLEVPDDETLPSHLARELAKRLPDRRVIVENLGVPSYVREQQEIWFLQRLREGPKPDLVIFYDGANDMLFCGWMEERHQFGSEFQEAMKGDEVGLLKLIGAFFFRYTNLGRLLEIMRLIPRPPASPPSTEELERRAKIAAERYTQTADQVRRRAGAEGIATAFILQPSLYGKDHPTAREKVFLDYDYWVRPGLDKLNETFCDKVAAAENSKMAPGNGGADTHFFDLTDLFDSEQGDVYFDVFHVGPRENQRIAEAIAESLKPLLPPAGQPSGN